MKKSIIILLPLLLAACGGNSGSDSAPSYAGAYSEQASGYAAEYDAKAAEDEVYTEESAGTNSAAVSVQGPAESLQKSEEKIVYNGYISVETTEYAETMTALAELEGKYNAVVTSSDESTYADDRHYMSITIRVPSDQFHNFMNGTSVLGNIRNQSINRMDITKQYNDRSIEAEALRIQQTRLKEMLEQAETIPDMLAIEDRLLDVETRLNQLNSIIDNMDTDVAWSTVNISISEVVQYSPGSNIRKNETFTDRLKNAFEDSWDITRNFVETVLFTLIRYFPVIIILSAVYYAYRRWRAAHPRKNRKSSSLFRKKKEEPETPETSENDL